ncbi:AAA ATPase domain-containing protein [Trichoderma breve]|uniref:AAA ATPase domain-containing protein n=1 Tax=Trichoderma breve TaxID=2034170 RepID=A0A9W9BKZ0_9HYPO|nr:AAA ATPase domain-containing protein [Trichoderma breve]KAJ4862215.1 AAA ATPase domain-containing protein [Trichoderma breve]
MAPLKRSRRASGQQDEITGITEARASMANGMQPRKRVRLSADDRAEGSSSRAAETRRDDGSSSSESENDDGDDDDDHTDWDDQQATQKLMRRTTTQTLENNMVAESGIIESITCYNFMCHERLHVELGPLINFIVGENGSGKSAVLTALTLCLGGKASDTNRGGSLKSFVKEGREQGSLVVKIKNAGTDAYQPDIYGPSITVERHFSKSGSSGFKIKTDQGKVVSTKKQEVDEISEWYALQIGNPLTVLSQDNARQFLNAATPAQKYKYFVSGVQLEQLDNDYKMSQDTLDKTLILREDLNEKIGHVKKEMDDAQRLAEIAQKNQGLREKARHYRNQLVWSQVVERERELEQRNADLNRRDEELISWEADCEKATEALAKEEEKLARVQEAREALGNEENTFEETMLEAEAAWNDAKRKQTELQREERDAHMRLKTLRTDMQSCESKIKEEEKRLDGASGSARAQKDQELSEAQAQEKRINEEITKEAAKRAGELLQQKKKEVVMAQRGVKDLEQSSGSALDGYDADLIRLAKAIERETGFESKPLGPLGTHVTLRKPEWSGILEKTFGENLNAFVVQSKRDQTKLSNLIQRMGLRKQPPIYIAYGGTIDTSAQEPDPEFDTILRVLAFDNELVRSQLVINNQIEKVILVKDRLEAERVMIDNNGPPRNVVACICFHDGRGKRTSPVTPTNLAPRMQSDSAQRLLVQKENLRQLGLEVKDLMIEERQARQRLEGCEADLKAHQNKLKDLESDIRRIQADIQRISLDLDAFEGVDGRLVALREEREAKQTEEEQLGLQYGNLKLEKRELSKKAEEAKARLDAEKDIRKDHQSRVAKAEDKVKKHESFRKIAVAQKNAAFERRDIEINERRRAEAKRDQKIAEVADFIQQAEQVSPDRVHIPEDETYASLEIKYAKVCEQLAQREARQGATDQQIYDRAVEARTRYEDVMKKTRDVDDTIASLNYLLSERGFRGKIDIDHRNRKVNLQIEPDKTRKSSSGRNTKTLSGGEKSFSSICMLLSVWEAIGSPIRCLDEFDVFMDNVNRAISTNMLVDAARRSVSRQYILITPNAIEGRARLDKDVKIIRLTDPRQRTLI